MKLSPPSIVVLLLACFAVAVAAASARAEDHNADSTVYEIQSRWIQQKYLHVEGDRVQTGPAEGDKSRWILQPVGASYLIKNLGTNSYLQLEKDSDVITTSAAAPTTDRGRWIVDTVDEYVILRNEATGKYVNIENQQGPVDSGLNKKPDAKNWWSGLWKLNHVAGPKPPRFRKNGQVLIMAPQYGSTIKGDTQIQIKAPGLTKAVVKCWTPGTKSSRFGEDATVGTVALDAAGEGAILFPANDYPHGPITIRISATDGKRTNNYYLMVYNAGGKSWNQGAPAAAPPSADGMKLVFADDFDNPQLSISKDGKNTTYTSHKPGGGDFSAIPFADHENKQTTPFAQIETYLRLRVDQHKNTSGLISSINMAGQGITAKAPCYFECRFLAPSAPGTWPAFWIMNTAVHKGLKEPADELDVIEAYGGEGPGHPNQVGYWIASHYWNQGPDGKPDKSQPGFYGQIPMTKLLGCGGASWFETFHTYGVLVGLEDTVYYCDDIEVASHKTARLSASEPFFFFVNLAVGGGWPVDLSQYDGVVDMYVDYVRVYQK